MAAILSAVSWIARVTLAAAGVGFSVVLIAHPALEWPVKALILGMFALAWLRPLDALIATAALLPIAGRVLAAFGMSMQAAHVVVLPPLTVFALRSLRRRHARPGADVGLLALVAACSLGVELAVERILGASSWAFAREWFSVSFLYPQPATSVLDAGLVWAECLGLFLCTRSLVNGPDRAAATHRLAWGLVTGGTTAALFTIQRIVELSLKSDPRSAIVAALSGARLDSNFADVNAAGSFFVLVAFAALDLGRASWPMRAVALAAATACAAAVWLSGSKIAIAALLIVAIVLCARHAWRGRTRSVRAAAATAAVVLIVGGGVALSRLPESVVASSRDALRFRRGFLDTSLGMIVHAPITGVGLGRYYTSFPQYAPAWLMQTYPRENAHNQYLQIAAELGLAGLAAWLWVVGRSLWNSRRALTGGDSASGPWGLAAGMIALLITCLSGHPLILPPIALTFWLALGVLAPAAAGAAAPAGPRRGLVTALAVVAAVLLIASVPLRLDRRVAELDLTHVAGGVSRWSPASAPPRTRTIGRHARFYVAGDAARIDFELQRAAGIADSVHVDLHFEGRLANRITLDDDEPHPVSIAIPPGGPRFRVVELFVTGPPRPEIATDAGVRMTWIRNTGVR